MFEVETAEVPPGTVAQEMQTGYAIGERVLRPSFVGVAKRVKPTVVADNVADKPGESAPEAADAPKAQP
jgi:molecular chaperone GrpE